MPNQKDRAGNRELVIEHITYDATHRSTTTPYNTSMQRSRSSKEQVSSRTPAQQPDIITHILTQQRAQKAARRQEKMISKANSSGRYIQLSTSAPASNKTKATTNHHHLRRKEKFSNVVMEKLNRSSSRENEHETEYLLENDFNAIRFSKLRTAIREGKMERVVPPRTQEKKEYLAPKYMQRPSSAPAQHTNTSPSPRFPNSTDEKEKFPKGTSKIAAYVEERKGKLNFPSPFSHIHFPSSLSRKSSSSSDSSTSSFACIGEHEPNSPVSPLQTNHYENQNKRISGEGSSPWYNIPSSISSCKPCEKKRPVGIRNLCLNCEEKFSLYNTRTGTGLGSDQEEEGVKPTPPLKDLNIMRKSNSSHQSSSSKQGKEQEKARLVPLNSSRKPVLHTAPSRICSVHGEIEGFSDSEEEETLASWDEEQEHAKSSEKDTRECPEVLFAEWSACYGKGEYRREFSPLIPMTGQSRDSGFYGFWDEVLDESEVMGERRQDVV